MISSLAIIFGDKFRAQQYLLFKICPDAGKLSAPLFMGTRTTASLSFSHPLNYHLFTSVTSFYRFPVFLFSATDATFHDDHQRTGPAGTDMGSHNNGFIGGGYGFDASSAAATVDYPHHQLTMHRQWYDEPLYANDTDEFYMHGRDGSAAGGAGGGAQGQQRRTTLNSRREQRNGVISLRSAGDISLPQNGNCRKGGVARDSQHKFQSNGDYSGSVSDIQSVTSRMSSVSVSRRDSKSEGRMIVWFLNFNLLTNLMSPRSPHRLEATAIIIS